MAILSIQSHVVYGHAGNSAAVFPMQRLGKEVWAVNTVEFSNHTGYGSWKGKVLGAELTRELVTGLKERRVLGRCEAVLSGYLGDADTARAIIEAIKTVREESPNALYCCDPVMGDVGRGIYVREGIPEMIKNELLPVADIVCPNQFELDLLTGYDTSTPETAIQAVLSLHGKGPSIVLVTSYKEAKKAGIPEISMIVSDRTSMYRITTPELSIGSGAAGTGDLTTAVFLSHYLETRDIKKTLELCAMSVFGIIKASAAFWNEKGQPMELQIINAQNELCNPSHIFKAEKFSL
jgi:pyridoxine kinase